MIYASLFTKERQPLSVERMRTIVANDKHILRDDTEQLRLAVHQRIATPQALAVAFGVGFLAAHYRPQGKPGIKAGITKDGKKLKYLFDFARMFAVPLLFAEE